MQPCGMSIFRRRFRITLHKCSGMYHPIYRGLREVPNEVRGENDHYYSEHRKYQVVRVRKVMPYEMGVGLPNVSDPHQTDTNNNRAAPANEQNVPGI
ncbi:hypothetical protein D3C80_1340400 [compost metagenome]